MVSAADDASFSESAGANSARAAAVASSSSLQIVYLPPEQLRPSRSNARQHSKRQLKQLAKSIERFGFVNPVLISDDFEIIAGHGRVEAAKSLGLSEVPTVRLSNLSAAERRAYVIADNRLAQLAGWDHDLLASELKGLLDLQFDDIELTGFSVSEIDLMLEETSAEHAGEQQPAAENEGKVDHREGPAVSRAGDVWLLGPHRLQCGESDLLLCDLVVRHWAQCTGTWPRLQQSGLTFQEVETVRGRQAAAPDSSKSPATSRRRTSQRR